MDLHLLKSGLDLAKKKKKWFLLFAAFGFTSYSVYKVYHSPSIAQKRKKLSKLLTAFISIAEAVSDSADAIGFVSKEFKAFLQSNTDQIPNSFNQILKITNSNELSKSVITLTQALTIGILHGYKIFDVKANPSFLNLFMDEVFTSAGSGFASVVVGSFAKNLAMGFYSSNSSNSVSIDKCVNVVFSDDKFKELIGDCIQLFVSTAVTVYLEKTMDVNTYDELFAGLTNPKHDTKVRDVLVTVCNGAIETLVNTSHHVLTSSNSGTTPYLGIDQGQEVSSTELQEVSSFDEVKDSGGWVSKVSSTLAVPSNRRFVLDVTGRVTFETVRSFLEILLEKLYDAIKRCVNVVHEAVVESGLQVVSYVTAKSSVIATICFSFCLHIFDGVWVLVPA